MDDQNVILIEFSFLKRKIHISYLSKEEIKEKKNQIFLNKNGDLSFCYFSQYTNYIDQIYHFKWKNQVRFIVKFFFLFAYFSCCERFWLSCVWLQWHFFLVIKYTTVQRDSQDDFHLFTILFLVLCYRSIVFFFLCVLWWICCLGQWWGLLKGRSMRFTNLEWIEGEISFWFLKILASKL